MAKLKGELCGMTENDTARLIRLAAKAAFARFDYPFDGQVTVTITDNEGIRAFNKEFRNIDAPTDVLSFPLNDFYRGVPDAEMGELVDPVTCTVPLGDMIISAERARAQAKEYGHSFARECAYLTVHSMLHLLGYDHLDEGVEKAAMRAAEEAILAKLGLSRKEEGEEQ